MMPNMKIFILLWTPLSLPEATLNSCFQLIRNMSALEWRSTNGFEFNDIKTQEIDKRNDFLSFYGTFSSSDGPFFIYNFN